LLTDFSLIQNVEVYHVDRQLQKLTKKAENFPTLGEDFPTLGEDFPTLCRKNANNILLNQ